MENQKPLETAVAYAATITSPWGIKPEILKAGAADLVSRLQALEAEVAALKESSK